MTNRTDLIEQLKEVHFWLHDSRYPYQRRYAGYIDRAIGALQPVDDKEVKYFLRINNHLDDDIVAFITRLHTQTREQADEIKKLRMDTDILKGTLMRAELAERQRDEALESFSKFQIMAHKLAHNRSESPLVLRDVIKTEAARIRDMSTTGEE